MKRRAVLGVACVGVLLALAALGSQKKPNLLVLEWAAKGSHEAPPVAVLIEMGMKDARPTSWAGRAVVEGAKVVHREGYRFRDGDKLVEPDGWDASSHRPLRAPPNQPAIVRTEGMASVGVVLHLAEVKDDATLTVEPRDCDRSKEVVSLKDVLAGHSKKLWAGTAVVRLVATATPVVTAKTEDDFPAAAYGPDGTLWLAYISYTVRDESRRIEQHPFQSQPKDFRAEFTPEFADQLFVKYYRDGKWSEPIAVTGAHEDLVRCAIGVEKDGTVWAVYSANRQGNYDLYARSITRKSNGKGEEAAAELGKEQRLTTNPGPDIGPVLCTTQQGRLRVLHQSWVRDRGYVVPLLNCNEGQWISGLAEDHMTSPFFYSTGSWSVNGPGKGDMGSAWHPAIAAGPGGEFVIAFDSYGKGDYDIAVCRLAPNGIRGGPVIANSSRFEARPSVCYDAEGRLWIAYEEGPERWGKDYGAFVPDRGHPLYDSRNVRVVCLDTDGKLYRPAAELPTVDSPPPDPLHERIGEPPLFQNYEKVPRYAYPKIGIDGKGRVWLTYRQKFGSRYTTHPGSYWLTFARRLDGDRWSEPIEVHHSDGPLDSRPVLLPHAAGGLLILHNTDGRYTTPNTIDNQIYRSTIDLPGDPVEPKLVPHDPGEKSGAARKRAEEERAAVKRVRDYRVECGGKTYRPLRGDFHRHTEISWDGGPDGSLEDMFRYAIDAAALDWVGNADHDNGAGREYPWWLTQKLTDAYHVPGAFVPLFSYERSVSYPMGHRNCVFAKRGVRTLPRLAPDGEKPVAGVHPDDTKMLYRYLHELGGICASHTSATGMGTDWRDNDPEVEPVVEIYQGDRMSYEYEEAPRSGRDPKSGEKPANIAGWYPKGFLNHPLAEKGYRLGFESSSDHWSTHISFTVVLAEKYDREGILDALRQRHCYAATDNIVLDVKSGPHLMGDEFKTGEALVLEMHVIGTAPLARIDVLRDSEVVETIRPDGSEYRGKWTDPKPAAGRHYYYVRVEQKDRELAWASPLWVEYAP